MIRIPGLTAVETEICEILWEVDTPEELAAVRAQIPPRLRPTLDRMAEMIRAAVLDHSVTTEEDCETARDILSRF